MSTAPDDAPRNKIPVEPPAPAPLAEAGRSPAADAPTGINWGNLLTELLVPILAIFTALVIGALIILATGASVLSAYNGLFFGAVGSPLALANTLVEATPYILAGLAVALGFKCGLFNIGVEGQLAMGAICSAVVGFQFTGLPMLIHLPLALLAGAIGGGIWGAIPGLLRAKTGAHEVITTIMLNYVAIRLTDYLIKGPFRDRSSSAPRTPFIAPSAELPYLFGADYRLHAGFILALIMVFVIWWLLNKSTPGFEIRTVGANPDAAKYAGMSITRNFVLAMALSGALGGLAGASQVLGLEHNLKASFSAGYGFDSIAIALLAKSNPIGIIPAAIFWGALRNGAGLMQLQSGISISLINIIQALVIVFVAADQIVRGIYRIRRRGNVSLQYSGPFGRLELPINKWASFRIPTPPEINVEDVHYTKIRLKYMLALVKVRVTNFNNVSLTIQNINYKLDVPGQGVAVGKYEKEITIKPQSEMFVYLPVRIKWKQLSKTIIDVAEDNDIYAYILTCHAMVAPLKANQKPMIIEITKPGTLELRKRIPGKKIFGLKSGILKNLRSKKADDSKKEPSEEEQKTHRKKRRHP